MGKKQRDRQQPVTDRQELRSAEVIASHGRHFVARDQEGKLWQVFGKGKKREVAVGDVLTLLPSGDNQAWVESIEPRTNLLYRSDALRSKLFASNVDQVMLVLAISPPFSTELLGRTLLACHDAHIPLILVFNKMDVLENEPEIFEEIQEELAQWTNHQVDIHWVSLTAAPKDALESLEPDLMNKTTLVLGQSGMGKSTLINLLIPHAKVATNEISMALNAGKHTTTHTQMHEHESFRLIDSPGFQAFGLHHLTEERLLDAFDEIQEAAKTCRFDDCQHRKEPQCAVKEAVENGEIAEVRYLFYLSMQSELIEAQKQQYL